MNRPGPIEKDIVLVGGGHAHVHMLAAFAKRPEPGARLTLVTKDLTTPYSGMLPGVIAGLYRVDEAHIDLVRLAAATGTRLIHAEAVGLDRAAKRVLLRGRPPLAYDLVSLDVGITPALDAIEGAAEHGIAVKPIGSFLAKLDALIAACRRPDGPRRIVVAGGGAGGVELLLSMRTRLHREIGGAGGEPSSLSFALVTSGDILATHNERVRETFRRALAERGVRLIERHRIASLRAGKAVLDDGTVLPADSVLVTTQATAPRWLAETGLKLAAGGFVAVGPTLQSLNDPDVFAAGDCAELVETPREKAGVYAVRAGPPLARNLRLRARGVPPLPWRPQARHLALISTGERYAVASRGPLAVEGAWVWRLKDWIDRRWMRMYQDAEGMLARMAARPQPSASRAAVEEMRCGGCAAKVGPGPLGRALERIGSSPSDDSISVGLNPADDAAVVALPIGRHLVQTVDFFRAFVDDPYLFGEIAANHALNDVFAMGGTPRHALAIAVVPPDAPAQVEETLFQLLSGARACLDREGVALVGGHSSEGDLALGFSVSGEIDAGRIVRKGGLREGDVLVMTKPIGTGVLFAAAMRAKAEAAWIEAALAAMRGSNRAAASAFLAHGATAMTDVTGYGLVGHLGEMLAASGAEAALDLDAVPLFAGALALADAGVASTLLPENLALGRLVRTPLDAPTRALLFDPQTSGGLLAGVPAEHAAACVQALRAAGYRHATAVGRIEAVGRPAATVGIETQGMLPRSR